MGYITPEITGKLPGYLSPSAGLKFADVPNGLAAISKVPAAGWGQILAYMAFCEVSQDQSAGTPAAAGDFGFKVLTASDPEAKKTKLAAELANGRLAMMAIIGMFFQAWCFMIVSWRDMPGLTCSKHHRHVYMQAGVVLFFFPFKPHIPACFVKTPITRVQTNRCVVRFFFVFLFACFLACLLLFCLVFVCLLACLSV